MSTKPEFNLDDLDITQKVVLKPQHPDGMAAVWIDIGDAALRILTKDNQLKVDVYVGGGHEERDPLEGLDINLSLVTAQKAEWESNSEGTP